MKNSYLKRCYVCKKWINPKELQYIGKGFYRHLKCFPLSQKWLRSDRVKESFLKNYITEEVLDATDKYKDK